VRPDTDRLRALPGNCGDDAALAQRMVERLDLGNFCAARGYNGLHLALQPLARLPAIGRGVVAIVEVTERLQVALQSQLAQLGQQRHDRGLLRHGSRERHGRVLFES